MTTIAAADRTAAREGQTRRVVPGATASRRVARAQELREAPFTDPAVKHLAEVRELIAVVM